MRCVISGRCRDEGNEASANLAVNTGIWKMSGIILAESVICMARSDTRVRKMREGAKE